MFVKYLGGWRLLLKPVYIFWRAIVCWPLLRFCRPYCILRDVWIRTHRASVSSRRATNLATHLHSYYGIL
jgi:hypothetical protein